MVFLQNYEYSIKENIKEIKSFKIFGIICSIDSPIKTVFVLCRI